MIEFLLLVCGLLGLWLGSETLIKGATSLADRYGISDALFGMLVLAVGTDLPELFVTLDASARSLAGEDLTGMVIGSAIGSSIGQFALVFGVAGFVGFKAMQRRFLPRNSLVLLGSVAILYIFCFDSVISRAEGTALIVFYAVYLALIILTRARVPERTDGVEHLPAWKAWSILAIGFVLLLVAAEFTVVNAHGFAQYVGLSDMAVSAIVIGMGSSLPELSVSFIALMRRRAGLSVGNLVGSNVFDTLLVPGVGAVLFPLVVPGAVLIIDLPVLFAVTVLILGFLYVSRRGIQAPEASILLGIYVIYAIARLGGPGS